MRRLWLFAIGIIVLFTSCPTRGDGGGIVRYPIVMSDYFYVGARAYAGRTGDAGWLVQDTDDPRIWKRAPAGQADMWEVHDNETYKFYGMRLFNVDRDVGMKSRMDLSEYDGITFKYRASAINTEARLLDCGFWWAYVNRDYFPEWNYEGGFANPDPNLGYKEVVIPFYKMNKWGTPQADSVPCNDTTKFNPNNFRGFRFDGRITARDGDPLWLEIVDFAFFKYE